MSKQIEIRATYMRGGTSKGVFFSRDDLPEPARNNQQYLDQLLMRIVGSPDPYGKHIDGMGAATSSTSKVVIVSKSERKDCDVDYLFGAVGIEEGIVDWSGNCGNLTTAVGPFAISRGLVSAPHDGVAKIRIWQANIRKIIVAHVPMQDGEVAETGEFQLDGVPFPAAEIRLEFMQPGGDGSEQNEMIFPTGKVHQMLDVPGFGKIEATLINAGNPTVFVHASAFDLDGSELQDAVNSNPALLGQLEAVRAFASVSMGLASNMEEATALRPATPKIALLGPPMRYQTSNGREIAATDIDLVVRILSMGKLHHAITGTGAVAIGAAAAVAGTIVSQICAAGSAERIRIGHPSGILPVGSQVSSNPEGEWLIDKVVLSRTARRLMDGIVFLPG